MAKKKKKPSMMAAVTAPIKKVGEFIVEHMPAMPAAKPAKKKAAKKKAPAAKAPAAKAAAPKAAAKPAKKKAAKKKKK